jgi:hypothetical protein
VVVVVVLVVVAGVELVGAVMVLVQWVQVALWVKAGVVLKLCVKMKGKKRKVKSGGN